MKRDSKLIISLIEKTLENNGINAKSLIDDMAHMKSIEIRKKGYDFSFEEHINGLVFSQLSNQRPWKPIEQNRGNIVEIFRGFNKEYILQTDPHTFVDKLLQLKCGNRAIKKQMESLKYNISVFKKIENDFLSLDNFVVSSNAHNIARELAQGKKYKLKQIGYALAFEYLRNVGVDAAKPDIHIKRILGR